MNRPSTGQRLYHEPRSVPVSADKLWDTSAAISSRVSSSVDVRRASDGIASLRAARTLRLPDETVTAEPADANKDDEVREARIGCALESAAPKVLSNSAPSVREAGGACVADCNCTTE